MNNTDDLKLKTSLDELKLKTGLFYTDYYTTQKPYLKMNPKDTEVFLNDYKFMKKILDYDLNSLEDWCKGLNDSFIDLRDDKIFLLEERIDTLESDTLEKSVYITNYYYTNYSSRINR